MNFKIILIFCIVVGFLDFGLSQKISDQKIKGLTTVAPPSDFKGDPYIDVKNLHANWVCLVPYGFCSDESTDVRYNMDRQWWGEKAEGVKEMTRLAKAQGLSVMLKPQVYMHRSWVGEYDLDTEKEWKEWEASYRSFIMFYVDLAIELDIEMVCIGTEYRIAVVKREKFWRKLIEEVRTKYCGKLTYSSNWDGYENVKIWDALDYIGISAYFPLSDKTNPTKKELIQSWQPVAKDLEKYAQKHDRPILFTEYGYLSVDGCAGKTWELEKKVRSLAINQDAQAVALDALYTVFYNKPYWQGGFLWKWFPEMMGHEGYPERDYTPQGKKAEKTMQSWFNTTQ